MLRKRLIHVVASAMLALLAIARATLAETPFQPEVKPLSEEQLKQYKLDPAFYKKGSVSHDVLIATSDKVADHALLEGAFLIDTMMTKIRPDVAERIRKKKVLCILVGHNEQVSEIPQCKTDKTGKELHFYNWRNRGFLDMKRNGQPTALFAEEDVLEYEGGMRLESVMIHEFGHVIDGAGFDKELHDRLSEVHKQAQANGLWRDGYAAQRFRRVKSDSPTLLVDALAKAFPKETPDFLAKCLDGGDILVNEKPTTSKVEVTKNDKVLIVFGGEKDCYGAKNRAEYWAEGVQIWFDTARVMDHDHNHIGKREQLKRYDPGLAKLCEDIFGDTQWRFVSPRERAGKGHLVGFDPAASPKIVKPDDIDEADQDYYDNYWKSYWQRLHDKYPSAEAVKGDDKNKPSSK